MTAYEPTGLPPMEPGRLQRKTSVCSDTPLPTLAGNARCGNSPIQITEIQRPRHRLHQEFKMSNPWLKKNPFMSMWLSSANSVANTARAKLTSQAKRQTTTAVNKASQDIFGLWVDAMGSAAKPTRRKKRK